jgi:hypothetical protein
LPYYEYLLRRRSLKKAWPYTPFVQRKKELASLSSFTFFLSLFFCPTDHTTDIGVVIEIGVHGVLDERGNFGVHCFLYEALGISTAKLSMLIPTKNPSIADCIVYSPAKKVFSIWKRYTSQRGPEMYLDMCH